MEDRTKALIARSRSLMERATARSMQLQSYQQGEAQKEADRAMRHNAEMTALAGDLTRIQAQMAITMTALQEIMRVQAEIRAMLTADRVNELENIKMEDGKVVAATVKSKLKVVK